MSWGGFFSLSGSGEEVVMNGNRLALFLPVVVPVNRFYPP